MLVLFVTVFVDLIGFGIVLPLLPFFAIPFGVKSLGVTALASVFSLMQFVFAPFWGRLSDRIGRRPVLLMSLAGSAASYLALAFCTSFWQIFVTRAFAGFFGANIAVASAYIADITTPENRSRGMGMIGAAFGLGFVFGPGLGALIAHLAENPAHPEQVYHAIGYVAGGICAINFLVACWSVAESRPAERKTTGSAFLTIHWDSWKLAFSDRTVAYLILLYFVLGFGFANFENLFALFIHGAPFHYDVKEGSCFFLFIGLVTAAVQGGLIGRLVKRYGEKALILFACLLFTISLSLIPFSMKVWHLLVLLTGLGLGQGLNRSSILGLISQRVNANDQGVVMGVAQSSGSLARIVGPIMGGILFDHINHPFPFVLSGLLILAVMAIGIRFLTDERGGRTA